MPDFVNDWPDGVHHGVPADQYHALPALSSGGLKVLHDDCPAVFWHEYLNPEREEEDATAFDIGTAAHLLVLQPELFDAETVVIEADSYRSKAAQEARAAARATGKVPLLPKHQEQVLAMREAVALTVGDQFKGGKAEVTYLWRDLLTGVRCKARPDWVSDDHRLIVDVKTSASASPASFRARMHDNGHHIQAAYYSDAHEILTGIRPQWLWLCIATKPPHCVTLFRPTPSALHIGADLARAAIDTYAECMKRNEWPGYADEPVLIDLPGYAAHRYEEWKAERAEQKQRRPANDRAANLNDKTRDQMIAWQAPLSA